jgi:N-acetylneuraminic acid mutarotase
VGGKIYVVGGFGGERELEVYDPAADRWSRRASIPRALHHAAAVSLNDKLYVVGGFIEGWTPSDEVHEFDSANDTWRSLDALPTPRGALAAAVLGGKIYAVGGIGWRGRNTPAHEVYDPAANRWTALAYVPTARDHLAAAVIDGRLYAIGGRIDGNYSRNLSTNESYDPATDRWEQRAPMPTARSGIAAAVLHGRIFVFGGEAPAGTFSQVEAYDPRNNTWSSHMRMPTSRHGLGAAPVAGRIYVISGGPTPGASVSDANELGGCPGAGTQAEPATSFFQCRSRLGEQRLSRGRGSRRDLLRVAHGPAGSQEAVLHHARALPGRHSSYFAILESVELRAVPLFHRRGHRRRIHRYQFDDSGACSGSLSGLDGSCHQR